MAKKLTDYDTEMFYWCERDLHASKRQSRLFQIQQEFIEDRRARKAINLAVVVFAIMTLGVLIYTLVR